MRALRILLASTAAVLALGTSPVHAANLPRLSLAAQAAQEPPAAESKLTFGLRPAGPKGPDKRPSFTYTVAPGKQIQEHLSVENSSLTPVTLQIYASDAFNTEGGGFDLLPAGTAPTDVGTWVTGLGKPVTVAARSTSLLPFEIAVPKDARPGDHAGGIVASFTTRQVDSRGNAVSVDNRVGLRIYARVAGRLTPRLAVEDLQISYDGVLNPFGTGAATVTYTLRNVGNVRLGALQEVILSNPFGWSRGVAGIANQDQLLPGNAVRVTGTASGVFPAFQLKAAVRVEPQGLPGDINPPLNDIGASARAWTIPWLLISLVLTVFGVSRELRRRQRRGTRRVGARSIEVPAVPVPSRHRHRVSS